MIATKVRHSGITKKGLYKIHRNPDYVGEIVYAAGFTSMIADPLIRGDNYTAVASAIATLGLFIRGRHLRTLNEEKEFEHRNYAEFNQYKKNTPRYFPKLTNLFKQTKP